MDDQFTDRELDVMAVLWDQGSATARTVHEEIDADLAYTTVVNILRTMREKGLVYHEEEGRAHRYFPDVERSRAGASALDRVVSKFFGGSTDRLLAHLVSRNQLSEDRLRSLRQRLTDGGKDVSASDDDGMGEDR